VVKSFKVSVRRGVTLVELMIAMLILAIVCVAWLEIIGIQSARKEARRREAVERLAGMMDAFMDYHKDKYTKKKKDKNIQKGCYTLQIDGSGVSSVPVGDSVLNLVFTNDATICYRLCVVNGLPNEELLDNQDLMTGGWANKKWLIGKLYDLDSPHDILLKSDKPFFTLPVCLWFAE